MKRLINNVLIILLLSTSCIISAQKYVHYYMNDSTYNGYYTDMVIEVTHEQDSNKNFITSFITTNGTKHCIPIASIDRIAIEDGLITDSFIGDYRIYEGAFENLPYKYAIVDTRACLFASKNGDFGVNDTILYASVYNNENKLFMTDANGRIQKVFDGNNLLWLSYVEDTLQGILKLTPEGDVTELPNIVDSVLMNNNRHHISAKDVSLCASDFLNKIGSVNNLANNYIQAKNNPELHGLVLLGDGLSIGADLIGVGAALLGGPISWWKIGMGVAELGADVYNFMEDLYPSSEQMEKFKKYYQDRYGITIKTLDAKNVTSTKADIYGTFTSSNGIKGNLYFILQELFEDGKTIHGNSELVTSQSYIVEGNANNLKPSTDYYYYLIYECEINGLTFRYDSDNYTEFTTATPVATTVGVDEVADNFASVKCSYLCVPEGATCGVQYGAGENSSVVTTSASDGEKIINISGLEPNTTYSYRAYIQYSGETYYGETKSFTTKPKEIPDLSGVWTFNQQYFGEHQLYIELVLESKTSTSATYKAQPGFYGVNTLSLTVYHDGSMYISCGNSYGYGGYFSGKFNEDFTSASGDSYYYSTPSWSNPGWDVYESWSFSR